MSNDATATDIMLGTLARNAFLAGFAACAGAVSEPVKYDPEDAWNKWEPSEADKEEVAELDLRLERAAMFPDTMEVFTAMGDRSTRDTAHLMDLCIAGTIDATIGYGEVAIKPHRVEELIDRIAKRRQDPDGNWIVELLPPEDASDRGLLKLAGYLTYDEKGEDEEFMRGSLGPDDFKAGCTQKPVYVFPVVDNQSG